MKFPLAHRAALLPITGVLFLCGMVHFARGQDFIIDSSRSSITVAVTNALVGALKEQAAGSLTTSYTGTIRLVTDAGSISFPGGSQIIAGNSGSWEPLLDGSPGSEPANYGAAIDSFLATARAALRSIQLDVTSDAIPLSNGQFDSRGLLFGFLTNANSTASYVISGLLNDSGSEPLGGYATNSITTQATLVTVGTQETLTIPVQATFVFTLATADDTTAGLKGQIVATRSAEAPLVLSRPQISTEGVTLQWQSEPGGVFQVLATGNLSNWETAAESVTSTTGFYSWMEPIGSGSRFYRLVKVQ